MVMQLAGSPHLLLVGKSRMNIFVLPWGVAKREEEKVVTGLIHVLLRPRNKHPKKNP